MTSGEGFPYMVTTQEQQVPRAYTLLSSNTNTSDLSSRSSAALRELIAENRARQLDTWHHHSHLAAANDDLCSSYAPVFFDQPLGWERPVNHGHGNGTGHVTLDLMQGPTPEFVYVSGRGCGGRTKAPKAEEEDRFDFWNYS